MAEWRALEAVEPSEVPRIRSALAATAGAAELLDDAEGLHLHTQELDALTDWAEAQSGLQSLIQQINGLDRAERGPWHYELKYVHLVRLNDDGSRQHWVSAWSNVIGPARPAEGTEPPPSPQLVRRLEIVRRDPALTEAVERYAVARSWPELYDVYEVIRTDIAGGQAVIDAWVGAAQRRRFTGTAKQYRHARPTGAPIKNPMSPAEGNDFIRDLIAHAIEHLAA
jgi:hypothetical protein